MPGIAEARRDPAPTAPKGSAVLKGNRDPGGTRSHRARGRPGRTSAWDSLTSEVLRTKRGRSHGNLRADSIPGEEEALLTWLCPQRGRTMRTVGYNSTAGSGRADPACVGWHLLTLLLV